MDFASLGFKIPSLSNVLNFYFFNVVPAFAIILIILYFLFEKFHISAKKVAIIIIVIPTVITGGIFFFDSVKRMDFRYLPNAIAVIGILFLILFTPTIISYFLFKIIRRGFKQAVFIIFITVLLLLFFYPKKQLNDQNRSTNPYYVSDYVLNVGRYLSPPTERITKLQSCSCIGIGTESYCYGMSINCKEIDFDNCNWMPEGEKCPVYHEGL